MTTSSQHTFTVEALGRSGDGMIRHAGQIHYVSGTLPSETLITRVSGHHVELLKIASPSPDRVDAPCSLAEICGGCSLQHMSLPAILDWKTSLVRQAIENSGLTPWCEPERFQALPHTRQRIDVALQRIPGGMLLGLHQRGGDPIDMTECALIHPSLHALITPLKEVLSSLGALTSRGALNINLLDSGPDLTLEIPSELSSSDRGKLAQFARSHNIPRITWREAPGKETETVVQWKPVFHHFANIKVTPPPASFLQATRETEQAIVNAVTNALPSLNKKDRIVELYAGCGTLTFPIAQKGQVKAYEGNSEALSALRTASHGTRAEGFERDLNRQPLLPHDLKTVRAVVLDPPYTGGGKQIPALANSDVRDIIYVSCNPTALQKDLNILHKAGFELLSWTVIDQFLWSTEVESVIILTRDSKRLRKAQKRRDI